MPAKVTRVELAIIVAALVVLVFSNQPPEPGTAGIRLNTEEPSADVQNQGPQAQTPVQEIAPVPSADSAADNLPIEPIPQPQPRRKRIAMVDARKCDSLGYPEVMYGEVTVRSIWNGTKFEWHKVCEVKEKNGTTSIWSFDDPHEGVIVTELPQE